MKLIEYPAERKYKYWYLKETGFNRFPKIKNVFMCVCVWIIKKTLAALNRVFLFAWIHWKHLHPHSVLRTIIINYYYYYSTQLNGVLYYGEQLVLNCIMPDMLPVMYWICMLLIHIFKHTFTPCKIYTVIRCSLPHNHTI